MRSWQAFLLLAAAALLAVDGRQPPPPLPAEAPAPAAAAQPPQALEEQVHRPFEITATTSVALALSLVVAALSNAVGVGGGAIFVPLFHTLLAFPVKLATALSQAVITGGALGSVAFSLGRRHAQHTGRPLIDFDLALCILPCLLLGVSTGVLLNIALPNWLLTGLLIALLLFLTYRTARTGLRLRQREQEARQAQQAQQQQAPASRRRGRGAARKLRLELSSRGAQQLADEPPHCDQERKQRPSSSASTKWQIAAGSQLAGQVPGQPAEGPLTPHAQRPHSAPADSPAAPSTTSPGSAQQARQQHGSVHSTPGAAAPCSPARHDVRTAACGSCAGSPPDGTGRGSCGSSSSEDDEAEAVPVAAAGPQGVACWQSAPSLLDGVLEPGSARGTPLPSAWVFGSPAGSPLGHLAASHQACHRTLHSEAARPPLQQPEGAPAAVDDRCSSVLAAQHLRPPLHFPWAKLAAVAALWALFSGLQLAKEPFPRCSWQYGALYACQAVAALSLAALLAWLAVQPAARDAEASKQLILAGVPDSSTPAAAAECSSAHAPLDMLPCGCPGELAAPPTWTARQLALASGIALAGGTVAGTLGIGGGMLLAPLMLELGVQPQAASATSGLMVLFSASTAVLSFAAAGRLNVQYALVFGAACLVAAFAGTFLIGRAVRRSGRASLLVLTLAGIIGAGALVTLGFSGPGALAGGAHPAGGGAFCGV